MSTSTIDPGAVALAAAPRHHVGASVPTADDLTKVGLTANSDGSFAFDSNAAIGTASSAALDALSNSASLPAPVATDVSVAVGALTAIAIAAGAGAGASAGLSLAAGILFAGLYAGLGAVFGFAQGGPGNTCCQSGSGRYGSCGAAAFSYRTQTGDYPTQIGAFEQYACAAIELAFNQIADCTHEADPAAFSAAMLPVLVAAWNRTHGGPVRTLSRRCNINPNPGSSAGFQAGAADGNDPISVGLNYVATLANCPAFATNNFAPCDLSSGPFPVGASISLKVNSGPVIAPAKPVTVRWIAPAAPTPAPVAKLGAPGTTRPPIRVQLHPTAPSTPTTAKAPHAIPIPKRPSAIGPVALLGAAVALTFGAPIIALSVIGLGAVGSLLEARA
jgi:hypothetical protein